MKNVLILWLLAALFILSCSKEKNLPMQKSITQSDLLKLNEYKPSKVVLPGVFQTFRNEMKANVENTTKSTIDPVDRTVDEATWLTEALTNYEYGFKRDSIEEVYVDTIQLVFDNKSINPQGIPIIDGIEIADAYANIQNSIIQNNNMDYLFWATRLDITSITNDKTTVDIINAGGPKSDLGRIITPLPPGAEIDPFPSGYWNFAGSVGYYMVYAEADFWNKIRAPGNFQLDACYVATYSYGNNLSAYDYGNENKILWGIGHCESYAVSNNKMNQYLYSSKSVIDDNNPHVSNPNLIIGYFKWNCWEFPHVPGTPPNPTPGGGSTYYNWFEHAIDLSIYEISYVGIGE